MAAGRGKERELAFAASLEFKNTVKFQKCKPRGLHFSKALFEGLIYGGKFAFLN